MTNEIRIVIISDGTGETASLMTKAAVVQFSDSEIVFTRYKNIRTKVQIDAIFEDAIDKHHMVVYTLVSPELRRQALELGKQHNLPTIDLLGPLLNSLAEFFESQPKSEPGLFHNVNEHYFKRIAAMEYTIHHDDGKNLEGLGDADVILVGISRTSKTPLSMYLSLQGYRVANVPLVRGIPVPEQLFQVDQKKIVALTIQADVLHAIRKARLERLAKEPWAHANENYASFEHVVQDIEYAQELYKKNKRWPVFDVSGKALEENATEILRIVESRHRMASATSVK